MLQLTRMLKFNRTLIPALFLSAFNFIASSQLFAAEHAVITIYHHVSEDTPPSTSLSPAQFKEHMDYLKNNGFSVLPLNEVITALQNKQQVPDKTLVITFDDGYISIYEEAFPLLQQMGFPFTVFINTQPINDNMQGYMSWDQIRRMSDAGVIIANHMVNHPYMIDNEAGETDSERLARLRVELLSAEQQIAQETGQSHKIMAYPYGEYDSAIKQMVKEEGFVGIAQHSGAIGFHSDFQALPRYPLASIYAQMDGIPVKLESLSFNVLSQDPESPVTQERDPAVTLQFAPGDFRVSTLACSASGENLPITWLDREALLFQIKPTREFNSRRWGYICTAPANGTNRYFWYSKLWIRSTESNRE
jgi:poly-beta-1,6-N-acetyl-D-glucosamine N-deacetylase